MDEQPSRLSQEHRVGRLIVAYAVGLLAGGHVAAAGIEAMDAAMHVPEAPFSESPEVQAYQYLAQREATNYDPSQDISPRQLLILLEVSERTGANLGQALATGEFESAKTWNDFVRPTLDNGRLGSATGVWQFIPSTFHRIIQSYGDDLLTASAADASLGREHLDLDSGPFSDAEVRAIIRDTVDGVRDARDEHLQLLRHNFAVLAFAKHYLSLDSGARTPVEDYLFHFLGETRGRQILALAQGEARHTLSVAPPAPDPSRSPRALITSLRGHADSLPSGDAAAAANAWVLASSGHGLGGLPTAPGLFRQSSSDVVLLRPPSPDASSAMSDGSLPSRVGASGAPRSAVWGSSRAVSSAWGLPADSPVVTGNPSMFYRDGRGRSDPYTWAEFMSALASRVKARRQPAMVRGKYGVGFPLQGADMPDWRLDNETDITRITLRHRINAPVEVPKALITGPLDAAEMRQYKARLAALIRRGEVEPLVVLPPESAAALRHLGVLSPEVSDLRTDTAPVREALRAARALFAKDAPDDPALVHRLLPAERVALQLYDQRITRYAALQLGQRAATAQTLDLTRIGSLLRHQRRASKPYIVALQQALQDRGLQTQTNVRRGSKPRRLDGIAGKLTFAAIEHFQLHNGLQPTPGRLDPVTAALLGLPPLGRHIFLGPAGPRCPVETEPVANCRVPETLDGVHFLQLLRTAEGPPRPWATTPLPATSDDSDARPAPEPEQEGGTAILLGPDGRTAG